MQFDCYGFDAASEGFRRKTLEAHLVKTIGADTFVCFTDAPARCIHRIRRTADGASVTWAFGAWEDAATLDYIPINQTRESER